MMLFAREFSERSKYFLCGDQFINSHTVKALLSDYLGNLSSGELPHIVLHGKTVQGCHLQEHQKLAHKEN